MTKEKTRKYQPSEKEPFMNPKQVDYFKKRLLSWRNQLIEESSGTITHLQETPLFEPDIIDSATQEADRSFELLTRARGSKLIRQIDQALHRIEKGSFGYCEETGEPINVKRLEARPIATLSVEAQERQERRERLQRDD